MGKVIHLHEVSSRHLFNKLRKEIAEALRGSHASCSAKRQEFRDQSKHSGPIFSAINAAMDEAASENDGYSLYHVMRIDDTGRTDRVLSEEMLAGVRAGYAVTTYVRELEFHSLVRQTLTPYYPFKGATKFLSVRYGGQTSLCDLPRTFEPAQVALEFESVVKKMVTVDDHLLSFVRTLVSSHLSSTGVIVADYDHVCTELNEWQFVYYGYEKFGEEWTSVTVTVNLGAILVAGDAVYGFCVEETE